MVLYTANMVVDSVPILMIFIGLTLHMRLIRKISVAGPIFNFVYNINRDIDSQLDHSVVGLVNFNLINNSLRQITDHLENQLWQRQKNPIKSK